MIRTWPELDRKARLIKSPDPTDKDCWPKAPSKFVFIFEAINLAGAARFGSDWTGKELAVVQWTQSPKEERMEARLEPPRGGGAGQSYQQPKRHLWPKDFHVHDWHAEKRQPLWEENGRALQRLNQTIEWLAQRCRDGELTSHARFQTGGSNLFPMRAGEWNVESAFFHFVMNGGKKRHFFQLQRSGPYEAYVFFEKLELLEVLRREPDAPLLVGEADLSRLSPYLRLAVHVALERGYFDKDSCETKDVRKAEIERAWRDFIPDVEPVESTLRELAKLVAFPDPEAIEQGQRGAQSRKRVEPINHRISAGFMGG